MTCEPTKFNHICKFGFSFAFHFPAQKQVDVTFDHHENPVAFWAVAEPIPDNSDVELSEHEGAW